MYCCTSSRFVIEINGSRYECELGQHILVAPWAYRQLHPSPCVRLMLRFRSSCIDHGAWTNQVLAMPEELAPDVKILFDRLSSSTAGLEPLVESLLLRLLLGVQEAAVSKRRLRWPTWLLPMIPCGVWTTDRSQPGRPFRSRASGPGGPLLAGTSVVCAVSADSARHGSWCWRHAWPGRGVSCWNPS